jgi:hypothetical protein
MTPKRPASPPVSAPAEIRDAMHIDPRRWFERGGCVISPVGVCVIDIARPVWWCLGNSHGVAALGWQGRPNRW